MSIKALTWACGQKGLRPDLKIVLMAMADSASASGKSFCSNATLCEFTGHCKEETISDCQKKLCALKLISDTGKRLGVTGKIKVFQFPLEACSEFEGKHSIPRETGNSIPRETGNSIPRETGNSIPRETGNSIPRETGNSIPRESPANPPRIPRLTEAANIVEPCTLVQSDTEAIESLALPLNKGSVVKVDPELPAYQRLLRLWSAAYRDNFGCDYHTVRNENHALMKLVEIMSPESVMEIVRAAWERKRSWVCIHKTSTITDFYENYARIRVELSRNENTSTNSPQPVSRNQGTTNEGRSHMYGRKAKA